MFINPAVFVVRNPLYPQVPEYASICANITSELVIRFPQPNLLEMIDFVSRQMQQHAVAMTDCIEVDPRDYGLKRRYMLEDPPEKEAPATDFWLHGNRYTQRLMQLRNDNPGVGNLKINYTNHKGETLQLSEIHLNISSITYAKKNRRQVFAEIELNINEAVYCENQQALYAAYSLLSHFVAFRRGSATLAIILREYAAALGGIETFCTADKLNLNMEALLTQPSEFVPNCISGIYFDQKTRPENIIDWQQRISQSREHPAIMPLSVSLAR